MAKSTVRTNHPRTTPNEARILERIDDLETKVQLLQSKRRPPSLAPLFRRLSVISLVVLCVLLLNFTAASLWLKRSIIDTDTWTGKTTALLQDESVRGDIASKITDDIFAATNAEQVVADSLPSRLSGLTVPLTSNLKRYTAEKTAAILASDQFQTLWKKANASAHAGIISSLENGGKAPAGTDAYVIYIDNDRLLLNLKPIVQNVQNELVNVGLNFASNINTNATDRTITLTQIKSLPTILAAFDTLNKAVSIFGVLSILCGAGALALSQNKRNAIIGICISIIILMVLNVQALYLVQYQFVQQLSDSLQTVSTATGSAVYTIFTSDLLALNRFLMILSAIVLTVTLLTGQGKSAVSFRHFISQLTTPKRSSSLISKISQNKNPIISSIAFNTAQHVIIPPTSGQLFPLVAVTIASLLCLWVYALDIHDEKSKV